MCIRDRDFEVNISPNPSENKFTLTTSANYFNYTVYDVRGSKVDFGSSKNHKVIFNLESPGIYFVVVNSEFASRSVKIIRI